MTDESWSAPGFELRLDVRVASAADRDDIAAIVRSARDELATERDGALWVADVARCDPLDESIALTIADPDVAAFVATLDDVVIGFAAANRRPLADGRVVGQMLDLAVELGARSVGAGSALVGRIVEWADSCGCVGVDAMALPGARETKNFFEAHGFVARAIVVHRKL